MSESQWTETSSNTYQQLAHIAVPQRTEQIAAMLTLIPFPREASFRVLELASGEGYLAAALLAAFPNAQLTALDLSEAMRATTRTRTKKYGHRTTVAPFDLLKPDWYAYLDGVDFVVSSLCVHHLKADGKRALFRAVYERSSEHAALIIADLVAGQTAHANHLFTETWEHTAQAQARSQTNSDDAYQLFRDEQWNYYRHPDVDDIDHPSPLFMQLQWLQAAGFTSVDCFWMQAGHAIYGGYKATIERTATHLHYDDALKIARDVLRD